MSQKHPVQPIYVDSNGTLRFKENKIVSFLLDNGGYDMNKLACMDFSQEDREQFAQLIGYSLDGFSELSYVSDAAYETAIKRAEGLDERDARITYLESRLEIVRSALREIVPELFRIHPDDLVV